VLRRIGYGIVGLVAVLAVGAGAVLAVDAWRAGERVPPDCPLWLYEARGNLLDDGGVRSRAWAALMDQDPPAVVVAQYGSRPALNRSCVAFAGNTPAGTTVVFVDRTTTSGYQSLTHHQSLVQIYEVRLLPDSDRIQAASAWYTTLAGWEMSSGALLPLSGLYLGPNDAKTATVLSAADGFAEARVAPAVGDRLFDIGVAPDLARDPAERVDVDAVLLVTRDDGGEPLAIALPAGGPEGVPEGVRASFQLAVGALDVATLRTVAPAVSALRADPVYPLIRDHVRRPPVLEVAVGPDGVTLTPQRDGTTVLPSFTFPNPGN
jgi:hypothetical protein